MTRSFLAVSLVLACLCAIGQANIYENHPEVVTLTQANFQDKVIKSDEVWLVEFYAPWCGHCKALTPEWVKAAKALKGIVKVGAVNMDGADQAVGAPYGVKGFPTIKVFGADKKAPTDYQQGRDGVSIAQAGIKAAGEVVQTRLGGDGGGHGGGGAGSKVVELTDAGFDKQVMGSEEPWLVAFVAPWCGHCKNLIPNWESAAKEMDGKPVHIARVDATTQKGLAQRFKVEGFPSIKLFRNGKAEDYQGGRNSGDIVTFLENIVEESMPPPEVAQITSSDAFTDSCSSKTLCLIAFFPGMVDSSAKHRNELIGVMKKLTEKSIFKKFGFVWAEATQQEGLEKVFNIGDYPALVAFNAKRLRWVTLRGSFSVQELGDFVGRIMNQREATAPLDAIPKIADVAAWDGKDVEVAAEEEEMSLADIMGESLEEKEEVLKG